jgi:hypothetical protein
MAPTPRVKSLKREDYKQAPEWFDALLLTLNQNLGDTSNALANGLTQVENGKAELKVVELTMPLEYPAWRVIGTPGNPPFLNGWFAYPDPTFGAPSFRMLADGMVELRGLTKRGTIALPSTIFTLPIGYRPNPLMSAQGVHDGTTKVGEVRVHANGDVLLNAIPTYGGAVEYVSLHGIRFQAQGPAARVEALGAPFPLSVKLANTWPVKTCQVVSVFDATAQQPGTVGPVNAYWQTREVGMLTLEALWGLQPGRSYKVTLLVTAG